MVLSMNCRKGGEKMEQNEKLEEARKQLQRVYSHLKEVRNEIEDCRVEDTKIILIESSILYLFSALKLADRIFIDSKVEEEALQNKTTLLNEGEFKEYITDRLEDFDNLKDSFVFGEMYKISDNLEIGWEE